MTDKSKRVMIIAMIIIVIAVIILICVLLNRYSNQASLPDEVGDSSTYDYDETLQKVSVRNNYYVVETCVEKFYLYLIEVDTSGYEIIDEDVEATIQETEQMYAEAIYDMLDSRYIEYNNITVSNLFEKIQQISESKVIIDSMYVSERDANIAVYLVNGRLRNSQTGEKTEFSILVEMDMVNGAFKVILSDYFDENIGTIAEGEELNLEVPDEIEREDYNTFDYTIIDTESYISDIFADFKYYMIYDYELAYEKLNEEYSSSKFSSYDEFEEYAVSKIRNSVVMKLSSYQVNEYDDYVQYVCVDQNDNYYIFNVTGVMEYTAILDTYTIDIPQFVEKYNEATDQEKVILNLNKVMLAMNDGDYEYVYNVLSDTFKSNYFSTYEAFVTYMTSNFFTECEFDYVEFDTNAGYYTYKVTISDASGDSSSDISKTFIMQLNEGTDFTMSFNIE